MWRWHGIRAAVRWGRPFRIGLLLVPLSYIVCSIAFGGGPVPWLSFRLLYFFHGENDLSPKVIFKHIFGIQPIHSLGLAVLRDVVWRTRAWSNFRASLSSRHDKDTQAMLWIWRKYLFAASNEMCIPPLLLSDYYQFVSRNRDQLSKCFLTTCQ